jgi:hypothetical protein
MDQLKVFLKQAVKYRFWIAFGISLLLPIIGYFVGSGVINAETTKREGEIKNAKTEIAKYKLPGIVNQQYQPLAASKKEALIHDVDATWRTLFATQEPLLKWPVEVQDRFRKWGRKYPEGIDRNQVQSTIIDYTVAYPDFVEKIYQIFKPFNFEDGTGIVVAPPANVMLSPADFKPDTPPDLTKIWAEQERLWVVTALLDAVAKINDSVGAKDWEGSVVKQINLIDVGSSTDQDQKSMAKGETLVPADTLAPPGAAAPPPPAASPTATPSPMGGSNTTREVFYLKTDSQQFKALPIKISVLVDQARLQNFLVGLENSPMAIEVNEVEIAKPLTTVSKPAVGEPGSFTGGRGDESKSGSNARSMVGVGRSGGYPGAGQNTNKGMSNAPRGMGPSGPGSGTAKDAGGIDNRSKNDKQIRQDKIKADKEAAAKAKGEVKKLDQYYNVIEVTVYGRARFYLAPPAPAQPLPSTAATTPVAPVPTPETPKAESPKTQPPAADPAKGEEAPKAEAAAPKTDATPADAPKAEAPKADAPKAEAPKGDAPAPKL